MLLLTAILLHYSVKYGCTIWSKKGSCDYFDRFMITGNSNFYNLNFHFH